MENETEFVEVVDVNSDEAIKAIVDEVGASNVTTEKEPHNTWALLPPDRYKAVVRKAEMFQHQVEGYDVLRLQLEICSGLYEGTLCPKIYHLKSAKVRAFLQKELGYLGITVTKREELVAKYHELENRILTFGVQNDNGSNVIYIHAEAKTPEKKFDVNSIWGDVAA